MDYWLSFLHCFWMSCLVYTESSTHIQLKIEMNLLSLLLHIVDTSCPWKNYSKRLNYWRERGEKERKEGRKRKENGRGKNVTLNKLINLIDSTSNWYNKTKWKSGKKEKYADLNIFIKPFSFLCLLFQSPSTFQYTIYQQEVLLKCPCHQDSLPSTI